jgi:hypothetical protein
MEVPMRPAVFVLVESMKLFFHLHPVMVFRQMLGLLGTLKHDEDRNQTGCSEQVHGLFVFIDKQWSQDEVMDKKDDKIDGIDFPDMENLRPVEIHFRIG